MRLKVRPEDFRVIELYEFEEDPHGDYYVHTLRKTKIDTQEAIGELVQKLRVPRENIAFAGLKDRQGQTEQWISVRGRRVVFKNTRMSLRYRGRSAGPVNSKQSQGNRFEIVVRDLDDEQYETMLRGAEEIDHFGLPNYFDDQRFGCVKHGQGFALRDLLRGDAEEALKALVASPSHAALGGDVKLKQLMRRNWRDWTACASIARGPVYGRVFEHLVHRPDDFVGALGCLPTRMKLIHAFAYQSHLWNRAASEMLHNLGLRRGVRIETLAGSLTAWRPHQQSFHDRLDGLDTPLWGPDSDGGSAAFRSAMVALLARERVTEAGLLRVQIPGLMLKAEPRPLVLRPQDLRLSEIEPDEEHRGMGKATLSFALPRGSYATMVVKRMVATEAVRGRGGSGPLRGEQHPPGAEFRGPRVDSPRDRRAGFESR